MALTASAEPGCALTDTLIIDPNLRDVSGHYLEYDAALVRGLRAVGRCPVVFAHRSVQQAVAAASAALPIFRHEIWAAPGIGGRWPTAKANLGFLWDLLRGIRRQRLAPRVVCFAHTFINRQFLALALLPLLLVGRRSYAFVYLFRYQAAYYDGRMARYGFRLLETLARWRNIRLASDSARLAADLQPFTSLPVEVLPIPHVPPAAEPRATPDQPRPCHFVSLGNARDEKGILEIFQAIRRLRDSGQLAGCRFTLQCNDATPDIAAAVAAFQDEDLPGCRLLLHKLSSAAYQQMLHDADVVLLPYWRSIYAARTSGVFMEALSAGKPVIATEDTWMADQLAAFGAGLLCADRDPAALSRTILAARDARCALRQRAIAGQAGWTAVHNPAALARRLVAAGPALPPRQVALFYPWSDLPDPRGGAGQRCKLLVEFLRSQPIALNVMLGGEATPRHDGSVVIQGLGARTTAMRIAYRLLWVAVGLRYGRAAREATWLVWEFSRLRLDRRARRRLRDAVAHADVVLLEHPFWASVVVPEAHRLGRAVIITCHDILADQVTAFPALHRLIWRWESQAWSAADAVVAVSREEAARLAEHGIQAALAPNPTDTRLFDGGDRQAPSAADDAVGSLGLPFRKAALFVGSAHPPNIAAVQHLRAIAARLAAMPEAAGIGIVVVGSCAPPERGAQFVALGPVDQPLLLALYRAAFAVVIPLPRGTGSSLKTVEAMAAGLPIVGTPAAFRGLDVVDGETALVESAPDRFAAHLLALAQDEGRRIRIGQAARRFAERFDYRSCFAPYLDLLGLAGNAGERMRGKKVLRLTK